MRIGPAEAIDRLLVVAHEEELALGHAAVAQGPHEFHLQRIGVLKFVHQQQPGLRGQPLPQIFAGRADKQVAGADEEIVEIQGRQRRLSSCKRIGQAMRDRQQAERRLRRGQGGVRIEGRLLGGLGDHVVAKFFGCIAEGVVNLFARPGIPAAAALHLRGLADLIQRPLRPLGEG